MSAQAWPAPTIRQHEAYLYTGDQISGLGPSMPGLVGTSLDDTWRAANKLAVQTYYADVRAR